MSKDPKAEGKRKTAQLDKTAFEEAAGSTLNSSKGFDSTFEGRRLARSSTAKVDAATTLDINHVSQQIRKNPKDNSRTFWNAMKVLCAQKCGGAESAFRKFSDNKDGLMSFQNFQDLLEFVNLRFNPRTARVFYKQALPEGEIACSIQDFTGMLVVARIDRIRAALREYNCSLLRTSGHIDRFVSYLAMNTGEINRRRAITRFQRKFTLNFLVDLKTSLQEWTVRRRWDSPEVLTDIDRDSFLKIVENVRTIQGYETEFLGNIFSHTDRGNSGRVKINDLLVIMTLVRGHQSPR
jgi:Ca2+-binding EF-hand superfamily protein